jgi:hypothetical protein
MVRQPVHRRIWKPGHLQLDFNEMLQGRASTTATVGTEPLQIDLQIAK